MNMDGKNPIETKASTNTSLYLLLSLTLLLLIRVLPILKSPLSTYGYDFGFYFYAAGHAAFSWHDLSQIVFGGYNSPLFLLGHWLHIAPAITLTGSYFFAAIFLGLALYLLMKNFSLKAGVLAAALAACSLFMAESYNMFLWKETLALPFLVLALKFLMEKKPLAFFLSFVAVLLLHRTSAIILLLTSALYLLYNQLRDKNYIAILLELAGTAVLAAGAYEIFHLQSIINNLLYNNNPYVRSGLFLEGQNIFLLWWPSLILGIAGLILYLKKRQHALLPIFTALILAWISLKLPFYRRFLLYLDVSVIFFGAYFLGQINYSRKFMKAALVVIIMFFIYRAGSFALAKEPLISSRQIGEIQNFRSAAPGQFVLAVTADDAPWLLAYGQNIRLAAPGLFEDRFTYQQWQNFWLGENQRELLWKYPRPLYFYQRSYRVSGPVTACLKALSDNFYQYVCP